MGLHDSDLFKLVLDQVPSDFVRRVVEVLPNLYHEAYQRSFHDPALEAPEARYILPHQRRVLFERQFRRIASDCGLPTVILPHAGRNCGYTLVRAGQFVLTASAVRGENELVRPAVSRRQHATVNRFMRSPTFSFFNPPSIYEANEIYGILLHGPDAGDQKLPGFACLGFSSADTRQWIENFPLQRVMLAQAGQISIATQLEEQEDKAVPVLKKTKKGQVG